MQRTATLKRLTSESFDILVIGGGATGTGTALDAVSRGLKTALVERFDFASGTSSRSTKLLHGGVRYLEQAVKHVDRDQYKLVRDALHERAVLLRLAPHLTKPIGLVTPLYRRLEAPYFMAGLKLYDWLAGRRSLDRSYYVDAKEALRRFPMLKKEGLRGGVVYFDGQFDDARMNVCLALTASEQGAAVANYLAVTGLIKERGKLRGAEVEDQESKERFTIHAKVVVNACGPFSDAIRKLDDPDCQPMLTASSGIHIVLDKKFSPPDIGLLIPKTEDGRVLFLLPWLGYTLVGTTDNPAKIEAEPPVLKHDIEYILRQLKQYFALEVGPKDILSSWSGLRPLVSNPEAHDTARLSRDHIVNASRSGLLTVTGGKWTTYRRMALDVMDHAIRQGKLKPKCPSMSDKIPIAGGENYRPEMAEDLMRDFALERDVAQHLATSYGSRAIAVAELAKVHGKRLLPGHPYLEAEVIYGVQVEGARTADDILHRRTRLAFVDQKAAEKVRAHIEKLVQEFR